MDAVARFKSFLGAPGPEARGYMPLEREPPEQNTSTIAKAVVRLHVLCLFYGLGTSVWGYNIGVLSSILVHPGWLSAHNDPAPHKKGIVTGVYYVGTWLGYVFVSRPLSDSVGRRYAAMVGTAVLCAGAGVQACSAGFATMVVGRAVCGVGVAVISTSVPLYQSEISPAKDRGRFVTMNHIGFVVGLAVGLWVGYGMSFWTGPAGDFYGWRVSILLQLIPALTFAAGLPFTPESPRWLAEKDRLDEAASILHYLREGISTALEIAAELSSMAASSHRAAPSLFRSPPLLARLWRAALLHFMAQACGAVAMKYYLPTLLAGLGVGTRAALMAGAAEATLKVGFSVVEMLVVDKAGRRVTLGAGCVAMAGGMFFNGALPLVFPDNSSRAADMICVAFIFVYAFGYSLGFGPAAWLYGAELHRFLIVLAQIFPTSVRAKGLNLSASAGSVGSVMVAQVWPVGVDVLGSNVYFIFMAVNLACIPIIYLFYPETKGRSLEDMDELFGRAEAPPGGDGEDGGGADAPDVAVRRPV